MKTLFYNAKVITMDDDKLAEALSINDDQIVKVGSDEELQAENYDQKIDMEGKTILPGFIDAHSHLSSYAGTFTQADLEAAKSFSEIKETLLSFAKEANLTSGQWLVANGYDHNRLAEKKHPTKEFLDRIFPDNPVILQHQSGHFGVFNSLALEKLNLQGTDNDGYEEENAYIEAIKKVPLSDANTLLRSYQKAFEGYASYGITTVQEGMMVKAMVPMYQLLLHNDSFKLDVVGYPQINDADLFYNSFPNHKTYHQHFRLGGYKIILDGSPQGRTAWMRTPYIGTEEYGISSMKDEEVEKALVKALNDHQQLLAHCNGDRAAQQLLSMADKVNRPEELKAIRPVIIHGQLLGIDQLPEVKRLGFIPSFFIAHVYHWGDIHIENFGLSRASQISPANSALKEKILFTFHQDAPVIKPDMLETVWCASNRLTKKGILLGEEEIIPVKEALKAVTINAAYQYGEEETKGSLTKGKKADLVILDKNPLEVDKKNLREIKVLQTYKDGKLVYRHEL